MVAQAPVDRVVLGSAGITDGCPYDAFEATEDGLRSPEASESENRRSQRGMVVDDLLVSGGVGDLIGDSYAQSSLSHNEH